MTDSAEKGDIKSGSDLGTSDEPACVVCGCTNDNACEGGCWWVEAPFGAIVDLCSACLPGPRRPWLLPPGVTRTGFVVMPTDGGSDGTA